MHCEFHIMQEFRKRGKPGQEDRAHYDKAIRLSKRHTEFVDDLASKLCTTLGKRLAAAPRDEVFPAFLPDGVGTHGNRTSNVAEIAHRIFDSVRSQQSLYTSMRCAVEVLHRRSERLRKDYLSSVAAITGQQAIDVKLCEPAPDSLVPPAVSRILLDQKPSVERMANTVDPIADDGTGDMPQYNVVDRGTVYTVCPSAVPLGSFETACTCELNANVDVFCHHVQKCISFHKLSVAAFVKPWQSPSAWREQCMPVWQPPGAPDAVDRANELLKGRQVIL